MPTCPTPQAATARHALVTGVSSGIGRAIAERLLTNGWRVTGLCRTAPTESIEGLEIAQVDVTDFVRLGKVCDGLSAVDALVHVTGFMRTAPLGVLCAADGVAMRYVHVDVTTFLAGRLVPCMPAGGRILSIGSRTANDAPTRSQYVVTKAALMGMARSWAAELAPRGITVSVIALGAMDTSFLHDPARAHALPRMPPISWFIAPEEVTAMAASQADEYGGAITGQQIVMCGRASL